MQILLFLPLLETLVHGYGNNPSLDKVCTTKRCYQCRGVVQNIPSGKTEKTNGLFQFCRTLLSINECCPGTGFIESR
ncbi:Oidioi.mRNA.OKI2018_I69.XSR.g15652.t1.cds [Oikopleura dioica]|uniref:Oidioi.mRNA.OKI2018_I69.XSR.g15652.t1.cds n=1 Tax=Oikopleura dioica TaxID=34765 RepID=A0ABN7SFG1_OIKDI|nr:Oidioi.mRNA.OKI2018_I69.XSR.g15652.t1.cds [Oikopleura dioica]